MATGDASAPTLLPQVFGVVGFIAGGAYLVIGPPVKIMLEGSSRSPQVRGSRSCRSVACVAWWTLGGMGFDVGTPRSTLPCRTARPSPASRRRACGAA